MLVIENFLVFINNSRYKELVFQHIKENLDLCAMVENETCYNDDNIGTTRGSNKPFICINKSSVSYESSTSATSEKKLTFCQNKHNAFSNNNKCPMHYKPFYQNQMSPSSSLTSYETDYSIGSRSYQNNSDRSWRENHLNPHAPPRGFRGMICNRFITPPSDQMISARPSFNHFCC